MAVWNPVPDAHVRDAVELGWAAVLANPALVDDVLRGYPEEMLALARDALVNRIPRIHLGYPRTGSVPVGIAVVGTGDDESGQYLDSGGEDVLNEDDELVTVYRDRPAGKTTLYIYVDHPDVCLWWYRVTRRIMNVSRRYLRARGLYQVRLSGSEIAPQPAQRPEELFLRRLTVSFEYEERWGDNDALWAAFYPDPLPGDARGSMPPVIRRDDVGGGVSTFASGPTEEP